MSKIFISDNKQFEIEKSTILCELNELWSEDIGKIHVSELLLKFYENSKLKAITRNPWVVSNNAARQLHSSTARFLRTKIYSRDIVGSFNLNQSNVRNHIHPLEPLDRLKRREVAQRSEYMRKKSSTISQVSEKSLNILAAHLTEGALSMATVEAELSDLSEELTKSALSKTESVHVLHCIATELITKIIFDAERHIKAEIMTENRGENLFSISHESSELSLGRIERIATNMIDNLTENVFNRLDSEEDEI